PLDFNLKAGDVVFCKLDTDPAPGTQEQKSWLWASIPDPLNTNGQPFPAPYLAAVKADMQREEYQPGPSPDANEIRRARRYSVPNWRQQFSPEELATIEDGAMTLADGETSFGGTVASGVVSGLFTFSDIVRK